MIVFVTQKRFESFIQEVDLAEKTEIPYDIYCSENIFAIGKHISSFLGILAKIFYC